MMVRVIGMKEKVWIPKENVKNRNGNNYRLFMEGSREEYSNIKNDRMFMEEA